MHILVVEDETRLREQLQARLDGAFYDDKTRLPKRFDAAAAGMVKKVHPRDRGED